MACLRRRSTSTSTLSSMRSQRVGATIPVHVYPGGTPCSLRWPSALSSSPRSRSAPAVVPCSR
eukprot:1589242-Alexandrium_andersonii.AAC.1